MSMQGLLRNINFEIKDNELNKFKELDHNIRHAYYTQTIYILYQLKQFWRMQQLKRLDPEMFDKEYLNLFTNVKQVSQDQINKSTQEKVYNNNDFVIDDNTKNQMFQLLQEKINGIDIDNHIFNTKLIADRLFESLNNTDPDHAFKVVWMVMDTRMSHSSLLAKKIFDTCLELDIFKPDEIYLYSTNKEITEKLNYPSNIKFTDDKTEIPKNVDAVVISASAPVIKRCSFYTQKIFGSNNEDVANRLPMMIPILPSIPCLKLRFAFGWHRTLIPWVDNDYIHNNYFKTDNSYISWKPERIPEEKMKIYFPSHYSDQILITGDSKYEKAYFQRKDFLDETYESFLNYCIGKLGLKRSEAQDYVEIGLFNQIFKLKIDKRFPTFSENDEEFSSYKLRFYFNENYKNIMKKLRLMKKLY